MPDETHVTDRVPNVSRKASYLSVVLFITGLGLTTLSALSYWQEGRAGQRGAAQPDQSIHATLVWRGDELDCEIYNPTDQPVRIVGIPNYY